MSYNPQNPNGQATSANSAPVVLASDQPALQTSISDGTQIANTAPGDTGQNTLLTAPSHKDVVFSTTTAQAVATAEAGNFRWVSVQILAQGTNSLISFQCSNDNTNWFLTSLTAATQAQGSSTSTVNTFVGPLTGRYFRLNVTGISAGTTSGVVVFSSMPGALFPAKDIVNGTNSSGGGITSAGILAQFDDVSPTAITENQFGNLRMSANRNLYGTIRDAAGNERGANVTAASALVVDGSAVTQPAVLKTATTGGPTLARIMSAASTNATSTKASAGQVYSWFLANNAVYDVFIKFYNKASAPTVGTDTPLFTIKIPAGGASNIEFSLGVPFGTGIAYAITRFVADNDATVVALNDLTGFFTYA